MTHWFRVYDDVVDDPKVQRLEPSLFKALINLWCLTSANSRAAGRMDVNSVDAKSKPRPPTPLEGMQ
jgi:hypothetical protein